MRKAKKRLCFVVRMLSYAIQLRSHGALVEPRPLLSETEQVRCRDRLTCVCVCVVHH